MKMGMFLLGALIITCAVTFIRGGELSPAPANGSQDYGCAVLAVNVPARPRLVQIPGPAANFLEIGHWARDHWHRLWGEPIDGEDCALSADSLER